MRDGWLHLAQFFIKDWYGDVLDAEDYSLPQTIEKKTPIGCKLVIEKWENTEGQVFASLNLVYQSTEQLHSMALLDLGNTPMGVSYSAQRFECQC